MVIHTDIHEEVQAMCHVRTLTDTHMLMYIVWEKCMHMHMHAPMCVF